MANGTRPIRVTLRLLAACAVLCCSTAGPNASARAERFSIDIGSPSAFLTDDILAPGPGVAIGAAFVPTPTPGSIEIDALSDGRDFADRMLFSVDRAAVGLAGSAVAAEAAGGIGGPGDQSADIYDSTPVFPGPGTNTLFRDGDGTANPGSAPALGLAEPHIPGPGDNVDAYDFDMAGHPLYFSVGAAAPGALGPGDILFSAGPAGPVTPYGTAAGLGLLAGDDIDALALLDADGSTTFTGGDIVLYSLAPGSPTLALLVAGPGDILTTPFGLGPVVAIPAASLGLATTDNVDALTLVPEPAAIALAGFALAAFLFYVWRRPRRRLAHPPATAGSSLARPGRSSPQAPAVESVCTRRQLRVF